MFLFFKPKVFWFRKTQPPWRKAQSSGSLRKNKTVSFLPVRKLGRITVSLFPASLSLLSVLSIGNTGVRVRTSPILPIILRKKICHDFECSSCPHKSSNIFCLLLKQLSYIRIPRKDSDRELTGPFRSIIPHCCQFTGIEG